jgi:FtsP/CotA-like multicopper oxidase with cupredoxin domain
VITFYEVAMNQFLSAQDRRLFLKTIGAGLFTTGINLSLPLPAWGNTLQEGIGKISPENLFKLSIGYSSFEVDGKKGKATAINGTVPGPLLRWKEGEEVRLSVTNKLMDTDHSSIHWHGILVPARMDGVPGLSFKGIRPGETFDYKFPVKQYGTYWYHSHSAFQEQTGTYGPLIIDPAGKEPFKFDREHVVVLSDWTFENPHSIYRNLHKMEGYFNYQKRTIFEVLKNKDLKQWLAWNKMRMSPVDILDVTGFAYTYLINGKSPDMNWTGLFDPGEIVRLRIINASAMTNMDIRIPGLDMEVVMVDGKPVNPVTIHEFRIGVAETYDVLIRPKKKEAYTLFAEAQDRSGHARATLTPQEGLTAAIPKRRERPVREMKKIGMEMMGQMKHEKFSGPEVAMVVMHPKQRYHEPGLGLGEDGWKVLTYKDLKNAGPQPYSPIVDREMTINITANMERYMFSFDGKIYSKQPGPYGFKHNERLRLKLINHTMMDHPIHLHGMWMQLENGNNHDEIPFKHTILVKPGEETSVLITPVEKGDWAFHCHLLYHMAGGMFQAMRVS